MSYAASVATDRGRGCAVVTFDGQRWSRGYTEIVALTACDLADLSRRTIRARANHPGAPVYADIHVAIAEKASTARTALAESAAKVPTNTLVYVGTPHGLIGLIKDIRTLDLADGVFLRPLIAGDLEPINASVLPVLRGITGLTAEVNCVADYHTKENVP